MKSVLFDVEMFALFCQEFEEANYFEFDHSCLKVLDEKSAIYEGTYRDPDNYKSPVTFRLEDGFVSWDVAYGWREAYEEIQQLYSRFIRERMKVEWIVLAKRPEKEEPVVKRYCPLCGSQAAAPSADRFHLDEERYKDDNQHLYEGTVLRHVCTCCNHDFYLPEGN